MKLVHKMLAIAAAAAYPALVPTQAQETSASAHHPIAKLAEHYDRLAAELEKRKLADLIKLATSLRGIPSEHAYRAAFDLAVARKFYSDAAPAALEYLTKKPGHPENQTLAGSIVLLSQTERGELDKSLATLKGFLSEHATATTSDEERIPGGLICAMGEAYLQQLLGAGHLDTARSACRIVTENAHPDPAVRTYFAERLARIDMIGKPAPDFTARDIDGKPVRLSDLKRKVVLVDFWATWCPPCVTSIPRLREFHIAHKPQGFVVIGVNLDSLAVDQTGKPANAKEVLSLVRWFLLHNRASWPNITGAEAEKIAATYGVHEVPANFLIGRDGKIMRVELTGAALAGAIAESLGSAPKK
jgi:peroxiredoxin